MLSPTSQKALLGITISILSSTVPAHGALIDIFPNIWYQQLGGNGGTGAMGVGGKGGKGGGGDYDNGWRGNTGGSGGDGGVGGQAEWNIQSTVINVNLLNIGGASGPAGATGAVGSNGYKGGRGGDRLFLGLPGEAAFWWDGGEAVGYIPSISPGRAPTPGTGAGGPGGRGDLIVHYATDGFYGASGANGIGGSGAAGAGGTSESQTTTRDFFNLGQIQVGGHGGAGGVGGQGGQGGGGQGGGGGTPIHRYVGYEGRPGGLGGAGGSGGNGGVGGKGDVTLAAGGTLINYLSVKVGAGSGLHLATGGTLLNSYTGNLNNAGTLDNSGTLDNAGILGYAGTLNNSGRLVNSESITGAGHYRQTAGQTINNGVMTQDAIEINGGILSGSGAINGDVSIGSGASVMPGNSPGTMTINGDFMSSGNLFFEIGGLNAWEFDRLDINGDAIFSGGMITFDFVNNYAAAAGDHWDFLFADTIQGWDTLSFSLDDLASNFDWRIDDFTGGKRLLITERDNPVDPVPEPATMLLFGTGLAGLMSVVRKKKV